MGKVEIGEDGNTQRKIDTEFTKCVNCGANMVYNPEQKKLYCPHCESTVDIEDSGTATELDLINGLDVKEKWDKKEETVFRCANCGAKVVLKKGESAKTCPFCGTAYVETIEEYDGVKPNGVLPFSFGIEKAIEYSKTWAKSKIFAPRKFKKSLSHDTIKGVYVPCFTFDSSTYSTYNGKIGETHTRTVGSGKNRHVETYTVWRNISGSYRESFDDIMVTAGKNFDQKKMNKTAPYDTNSSQKYEGKFLLGYMAYQYDIELADCWKSAKNSMDAVIRRGILSEYTCDKVAYLNVSTRHENVTYKYVMVPIYIGNFKYSGKLFNFYVNGTTGKTYGKTPKSPIKIMLVVLIALAVVLATFLLLRLTDSGQSIVW